MYCSNCGNKLGTDSNFCSKCGKNKELPHESLVEQAAELEQPIINALDTEKPTLGEGDYLVSFVGKNADYYLSKWNNSKKPGVYPSWNFASFFITPFWLGYRKMYLYLVFYTLVVLGVSLVFIEDEYNITAIILSILMGLYGNTLYYQKAQKAITSVQKQNLDDEKTQYRLKQMGGTSKRGIFFGGLSTVLAIIVLAVAYFFLLPGEIIFGSGDDEYGVTGIKSTFVHGDDIYYEADFGGPINKTSIEAFLLKTDSGNEEMYLDWKEKVSPDWPGMYILLDGEDDGDPTLERGDYILRLTDGKNIISEGSFTIK